MTAYVGARGIAEKYKGLNLAARYKGSDPSINAGATAELGPLSATFSTQSEAGSLVAQVVGLADGEFVQSISPDDNRLAVDFTTNTQIQIGLVGTPAGARSYTITTSSGRSFVLSLTVTSAITANYFKITPMIPGRQATEQGNSATGHYVRANPDAVGNLAGSWDMTGKFVAGKNYRIVGTLRAIVHATGALYNANTRIIVRGGSNIDLTSTTGGTSSDYADKTFLGSIYIDQIFTFDPSKPFIGIYGANFPAGVRAQFDDVSMDETSVLPNPWSVLPTKAEKTLALSDVYVPLNTVGPTVYIPPGATQAHFKLTYLAALSEQYGKEVRTTARADIVVQTTGQVGFNAAVDCVGPAEPIYWRDGDSAEAWGTIQIVNPRTVVGNKFRVSMSTFGLSGPIAFFVEIADGAVNALPNPLPYHRPPYKIDVAGIVPTKNLDMAAIEWSDTGRKNDAPDGAPVWRTHPSHARSNFSANGENGLYMDSVYDPVNAIHPQTKEVDNQGRPFVRLHSDKFPAPVPYNGLTFPYQASMLQGSKIPDWFFRRGMIRAQIVSPSQKGAWSAFWAVGVRLSTGGNMWPPEIDFMEHFNGSFNDPYDQYTTNSGQHAGIHGVSRQRVDSSNTDLKKLGWDPSFNLFTQIHDYACVVTPDWVTHFIDGVETFRNRNISEAADGNTDWAYYPIINVAVRASDDYNAGTKDLLWYGLQLYTEDKVPALAPMLDAKPWALKKPVDPSGLVINVGGTSVSSTTGAGGIVVSQPWMFEDNFDRANENLDANANYKLLGGLAGQVRIVSNQLGVLATASASQTIVVPSDAKGLPTGDQAFQADWLYIGNDRGGLVVRAASSSNFVWLRCFNTYYILYKCINGTFTMLANSLVVPSGNDIIKINAIGQNIKVLRNGGLIIDVSLPAGELTSGQCGFLSRLTASTPAFDNAKWGVPAA